MKVYESCNHLLQITHAHPNHSAASLHLETEFYQLRILHPIVISLPACKSPSHHSRKTLNDCSALGCPALPNKHFTQSLTTEGLEASFSESFIIPIKKKISNTNKIKQWKRDILLPLCFLAFHLKTQILHFFY